MIYKPTGYNDVSPYLVVPDPEAVLTFCEDVFDATRLRVIQREDGSIMHAECQIGDSVLMMGGETGHSGVMVHIYLADPDACFDKAVAAGATVVHPMGEKGDGDRRGGFRTDCGTSWFVSKQM